MHYDIDEARILTSINASWRLFGSLAGQSSYNGFLLGAVVADALPTVLHATQTDHFLSSLNGRS